MSKTSETVVSLLLILTGALVARAHIHIIKLLVLGMGGLGAMYMMHNLAQDLNKIMGTWNKGPGNHLNHQLDNIFSVSNSIRNRRSTKEDWLMEKFPNDTEIMSNLVSHDPIGCARKYVCHISARSLKKQTSSQRKVLAVLRTFKWLDTNGDWNKAQDIGRQFGRKGGCEVAYSRCGFTGTQLDGFMSMFG